MADTRNLTRVAATLACSDKLTWADCTNKKNMQSLVLAHPHTLSPSRLQTDKSQPPTSADTWSTQSSLFSSPSWSREHDIMIIRSISITWMAVQELSSGRVSVAAEVGPRAARAGWRHRQLGFYSRHAGGARTHTHKPNLSSPTLASTSHSPSPPLTAASSEQDFTPPT